MIWTAFKLGILWVKFTMLTQRQCNDITQLSIADVSINNSDSTQLLSAVKENPIRQRENIYLRNTKISV